MKNGKFKIIHCQDCKKEKTIFINNIYAKESKWLRIIAIFILFIGTTIGIYFLWDMILSGKSKTGIYATAIGLQIPMWIYIILKAEDRRRVRTFNQSYVKESYR